MAKTQMLAKIEADAALMYTACEKVIQNLDTGTKDIEAWKDFAAAQNALTALEASVVAMRNHIAKWDGSTSLKNIFKNKKELSQKRDEAKTQFQKLSKEADLLKATFSEIRMEWVDLGMKPSMK